MQKVDATKEMCAEKAVGEIEGVEMQPPGVDGLEVPAPSGTGSRGNASRCSEGERGEKESADGDGWRGDDGERFPVVPRHPVVGSRC